MRARWHRSEYLPLSNNPAARYGPARAIEGVGVTTTALRLSTSAHPAQARADTAPDLQDPCRSQAGRVRLHRDVLQPETQACEKRDAVARRVRTAQENECRGCLENSGLFSELLSRTPAVALNPSQRRSLDFVSDTLVDGRRFRIYISSMTAARSACQCLPYDRGHADEAEPIVFDRMNNQKRGD